MNVVVISNVSILFSYSFSDSIMQGFCLRFNIQLTINVASIVAAYRFSQMFNARQPPPGEAIENRRGGVIESRRGGVIENGREGVFENRGGGATEKQKNTSSNK